MITMLEIEPEEWAVIPLTSPRFLLEVASLRKVDFGIVQDVAAWENAGPDDEFESDFWQNEFSGARDLPFSLPQRKRPLNLIFWNSNYSKRIYVAYRLKDVEPISK